MSTPTDPTAGEGLSEVLHAHRLHASMNHCLACYWRPTTDAGPLAEQHARHVATVLAGHIAAREAAAATRARADLRKVLDEYFDFDVDSWDETATPEPEDVWRLHRDLKAALAPDTAGESA